MKPVPRITFKFSSRRDPSPSPLERHLSKLRLVVQQAFTAPFTLQADFARSNSFYVAAAASMGLITSRASPGMPLFSNRWRVTKEGLRFLEKP